MSGYMEGLKANLSKQRHRAEEIKKLGAHDVKDAKEDEVHCKKLLSRKGSLECKVFSPLNLSFPFLLEKLDRIHTHKETHES